MIPKSLYEHLPRLKSFCSGVSDGFTDHDDDLLLMTFTHKTFAADYREQEGVVHNERLEFLGDSILGAHVATLLYTRFPDYPESKLTLMKIYLVKEETLAAIARKIALGDFLFLGNGEERTGGRDKDAILADALEAFIAYCFMQGGDGVVRGFIDDYVMPMLELQPLPTKSFKSKLQEYAQKAHQELPEYVITEKKVEESGNVLLYEAHVSVQGVHCGTGIGPSKKKAQESAAQQAFLSFNS